MAVKTKALSGKLQFKYGDNIPACTFTGVDPELDSAPLDLFALGISMLQNDEVEDMYLIAETLLENEPEA